MLRVGAKLVSPWLRCAYLLMGLSCSIEHSHAAKPRLKKNAKKRGSTYSEVIYRQPGTERQIGIVATQRTVVDERTEIDARALMDLNIRMALFDFGDQVAKLTGQETGTKIDAMGLEGPIRTRTFSDSLAAVVARTVAEFAGVPSAMYVLRRSHVPSVVAKPVVLRDARTLDELKTALVAANDLSSDAIVEMLRNNEAVESFGLSRREWTPIVDELVRQDYVVAAMALARVVSSDFGLSKVQALHDLRFAGSDDELANAEAAAIGARVGVRIRRQVLDAVRADVINGDRLLPSLDGVERVQREILERENKTRRRWKTRKRTRGVQEIIASKTLDELRDSSERALVAEVGKAQLNEAFDSLQVRIQQGTASGLRVSDVKIVREDTIAARVEEDRKNNESRAAKLSEELRSVATRDELELVAARAVRNQLSKAARDSAFDTLRERASRGEISGLTPGDVDTLAEETTDEIRRAHDPNQARKKDAAIGIREARTRGELVAAGDQAMTEGAASAVVRKAFDALLIDVGNGVRSDLTVDVVVHVRSDVLAAELAKKRRTTRRDRTQKAEAIAKSKTRDELEDNATRALGVSVSIGALERAFQSLRLRVEQGKVSGLTVADTDAVQKKTITIRRNNNKKHNEKRTSGAVAELRNASDRRDLIAAAATAIRARVGIRALVEVFEDLHERMARGEVSGMTLDDMEAVKTATLDLTRERQSRAKKKETAKARTSRKHVTQQRLRRRRLEAQLRAATTPDALDSIVDEALRAGLGRRQLVEAFEVLRTLVAEDKVPELTQRRVRKVEKDALEKMQDTRARKTARYVAAIHNATSRKELEKAVEVAAGWVTRGTLQQEIAVLRSNVGNGKITDVTINDIETIWREVLQRQRTAIQNSGITNREKAVLAIHASKNPRDLTRAVALATRARVGVRALELAFEGLRQQVLRGEVPNLTESHVAEVQKRAVGRRRAKKKRETNDAAESTGSLGPSEK